MSSSGAHLKASEDGREVAWMWRAVRKHTGKIIAIVVLACIAMTAFIVTRTKEYTAYTEILINPDANEFGNLEERNDYNRGAGVGPEELESEIRVIRSTHVINKVIDELNLDFENTSPPVIETVFSWFGVTAARSGEGDLDPLETGKQLTAFRKKLKIERDPLAYVLSVGYTSTDREQAALVTNTLARTYLEDQLESKRKALSETADNLGRSVEELAGWLKSRERESRPSAQRPISTRSAALPRPSSATTPLPNS